MTSLRTASAADAGFLTRCVALAADWRPGTTTRSHESVLAAPELAHYVSGWPLPGDHGVVAEEPEPVGAAWWRRFPADDRGYGFVAEEVPEVSVAVVPSARGRGVGTALLQRLVADARGQHLPALSLSVEADNPARRLYERLGFVPVGEDGAITMLLRLAE